MTLFCPGRQDIVVIPGDGAVCLCMLLPLVAQSYSSCFVDSSLYFCHQFTTYLFKLGIISDRNNVCACLRSLE